MGEDLSYLRTKETTSPCKEVSEERAPDRVARADLGDNLLLVSRLEIESRVAFGDP